MSEPIPIIDDAELVEAMTYHFRRSLEDEMLKGHLPLHLARAIDESPDEVVALIIDAMAPGVRQRLNMSSKGEELARTVSKDDLQLLLLALTSLQASLAHDVDVDLDGALVFCSRGRKMLKSERYGDAKRHFERALQIKPTVKSAWQGLAEAQEQLGQPDSAAESRRRANEL